MWFTSLAPEGEIRKPIIETGGGMMGQNNFVCLRSWLYEIPYKITVSAYDSHACHIIDAPLEDARVLILVLCFLF